MLPGSERTLHSWGAAQEQGLSRGAPGRLRRRSKRLGRPAQPQVPKSRQGDSGPRPFGAPPALRAGLCAWKPAPALRANLAPFRTGSARHPVTGREKGCRDTICLFLCRDRPWGTCQHVADCAHASVSSPQLERTPETSTEVRWSPVVTRPSQASSLLSGSVHTCLLAC